MLRTIFVYPLLVLLPLALPARADGSEPRGVALPKPQPSVVVTVERGVRIWRPTGTDETVYGAPMALRTDDGALVQYDAPGPGVGGGLWGGFGGWGSGRSGHGKFGHGRFGIGRFHGKDRGRYVNGWIGFGPRFGWHRYGKPGGPTFGGKKGPTHAGFGGFGGKGKVGGGHRGGGHH